MKTIQKIMIIGFLLSFSNIVFSEYKWQCYTNSNIIESIAVQGDNIWCGTTGGVVCWNKSDNTYRKYTISEGLAHNVIFNTSVDGEDNIWVSTFMGSTISKFDGTSWNNNIEKELPWKIKVETIEVDSDGIMWAGVSKGGVARFNGTVWTLYNEENGFVSDYVLAIAVNSENKKWLGTLKNGLWSFDGTTWESYLQPNSWIYHNLIQKLYIFDDVLWIIWDMGKLQSFDGVSWHSYDGVEKFFARQVTGIAMDNNNVMWLTTYNDGIISFKNNSPASVETMNVVPAGIKIMGNYPNPFNTQTTL